MQSVRIGRNDLCHCGSGRKFKRCCQNQSAPEGTGRITAFEKARPVFGDGAEIRNHSSQPAPGQQGRDDRPIQRIPVHYTYSEPFGEAECVYCFPVEQLFLLEDGGAIPAEWLQPGMRFRLDDGSQGTVTAVEPPRVWGPPSRIPNHDGNYARRVLGRVKHKGYEVLDVTFGDTTITTTPNHLFYSASRGSWVPISSMRPGELVRGETGVTSPILAIGPPRHGFVELYGIEVEEFHTYFVGDEAGSALVHNGMGDCFKKALQVDAQGNPIPHGFNSADEFQQFASRLKGELPEGTQPLFQGSSVTGASYKTGQPFDVGRLSDFDIGLAGSELFEKAAALGLKVKDGTRIGPLSPQDLENLGLSALQSGLSGLAGRPVNFMLFDSIAAALKRPSIWVP
jgi:SEC-C motif